MNETRILLGHISGAHGIRGDVLIKTHTEFPEDIAAYGPLASEDGTRTFEIRIVNVTQKGVVARVAGVSTRNDAEKLKGCKLFVARSVLPDVEAGAFYHSDLIGLAAVDVEGRSVGSVVGVHNFGAGDLLEVALANRRKSELLPFTDAFVPHVDLAAGRVTVVLAEDAPGEEPGAEPETGSGA